MKRHELESEVFCLLDGELDPDRAARLEILLLTDPEAREIYRDCALLHSALATRMRGGELAESWNVVPSDKIVALQRWRSAKLSIAAAVALFLVMGAMLWVKISHGRDPHGFAFEVTPGSEFTVTHPEGKADHPDGELLSGSRMTMTTGYAECMLEAGVRMLVQAPCDLTVRSGGELQLAKGSAWFHVPAGASGFRVNTKELEIVDLGTEFGVESSPDGDDEVHVFKGKVKARSLNPLKEERTLVAGEALSTDVTGRVHPRPTNRSRFLVSLPDKLPEPAVYHLQSRWIGDRYLVVDGDKLSSGPVKGDNGRWVLVKDGKSYLIKHPMLRVYLRIEEGGQAVVLAEKAPLDDHGHWLIEPSDDGITIANKATGKYLNIENLGEPPSTSLDRRPTRSRWTSGLWNLVHIGGGKAENFGGEE